MHIRNFNLRNLDIRNRARRTWGFFCEAKDWIKDEFSTETKFINTEVKLLSLLLQDNCGLEADAGMPWVHSQEVKDMDGMLVFICNSDVGEDKWDKKLRESDVFKIKLEKLEKLLQELGVSSKYELFGTGLNIASFYWQPEEMYKINKHLYKDTQFKIAAFSSEHHRNRPK